MMRQIIDDIVAKVVFGLFLLALYILIWGG